MFKDMFGTEMTVGCYFCYAELAGGTRAVQNIYKVLSSGKQLQSICVESDSWAKGNVKNVQCASTKAIVLVDYKEVA